MSYDDEEDRVPKFRSTRRALHWIKKTGYTGRLPADVENVFFKTKKEDPHTVAVNLADYSLRAGRVSPELEALLVSFPDQIYFYYRNTRGTNNRLSERLENALSGDSKNLCLYAQALNERLPKHLEDTITEPRYLYEYARTVLRGRAPEHLEQCFFKDIRYASKYAFDVIRGFASVKLPEALHNFVVMKSFETPDDYCVKAYIEASESDPNRIGNSTVRV